MTVRELRRKYLAFFETKGHARASASPLIPYDVTGALDETLLFNGSGMNQFKPYFRGIATPPTKRLMTAQKCLRTGDIEDVGDDSHLTMFEMLGNFSIGDYFKREAIDFSWEFMTSTEWLSLDPRRLSFTVFETDDEAYEAWSRHLVGVGVEPATRVFRLGEETNYWPAGAFSKGPPGPCGPNSEMFYWVDGEPPVGPYTTEDWLRDDEAKNWLEIWNDVFISSEWQGALRDPKRPDKGYEKTGMPDLPFKSIDTGMGLERTATVIGGFRSVYDTDAFQPIFRLLEQVSGSLAYGSSPEITRAMRIVADHLRAATFCISDGILPSNNGRGYVLRRLIRRAILKGARVLGFDEPFLFKLIPAVSDNMGEDYPELREKQDVSTETLKNEEVLFRRTLKQGTALLTEWLGSLQGRELDGDRAFMLYDTYGFPLEVTRELCTEAGVSVDEEGYRAAMEEAQERSRGANQTEGPYTAVAGDGLPSDLPATEFLGYHHTAATGKVVAAAEAKEGWVVVLDRTPFYAESGGQVGDTGILKSDSTTLRVKDTTKKLGVFSHLVEKTADVLPHQIVGMELELGVDAVRRGAITRHHTATHLLHAALRHHLGAHVTQAGSFVSDEVLRFDFTHGKALTDGEINAVEEMVNQMVWEAYPVTTYEDVPIDDARKMGAMALFGEKYADHVRVVQIGDMPPTEPSPSRELCGGIHVKNTGQIGLFKIVHEGSVASGVRRITAVAGEAAYQWVRATVGQLEEAAGLLKANPQDLVPAIQRTLETLKEERKKREKLAAQGAAQSEEQQVGQFNLVVSRMTDAEAEDMKNAANRLAEGAMKVSLVVSTNGSKLLFAVKASSDAVAAGAHAGNLIREVAKATGGGGGGRPEFATAGGNDPAKVEEAIGRAKEILAG
jgi:alanyl-tRNA synthetase